MEDPATTAPGNGSASPSNPPLAIACSHCGRPVAVAPDDAGQTVGCPHCGWEFQVPDASALTTAAAPVVERVFDDPAEALHYTEPPPEDEELVRKQREELDGMRIRQVTQARRSALRYRSYCLLIAVGMVAIAGQFVWWAVEQIWYAHAFNWALILRPAANLIIAAFCLRWAWFFVVRSRTYFEEATRTELEEPEGEPDFEPLNDGSQYARSLEELSNDPRD